MIDPQSDSLFRVRSKRTWLYPALCCGTLLICILLSNPFNKAGFNDDWSYGHVAMKLAATGRMQYNGWGSPILLFQAFWALPWIRTFGFSFPVLQIAMIPVSMGFVLVVYATGRAIGLSPELAAFASVATGTSPLFLPLAASFMTDASGCFFAMLCIYATIRCIQAAGLQGATRWLWVLTLAGAIGGANRQIVWAAPITLIPYLSWVRRADKGFTAHAIAAYGGISVAILAILHYFGQPYGPLQLTHQQLRWVLLHGSGAAMSLTVSLALVCVLASMPAFCCLLPLVKRRPLLWSGTCFLALAAFTFCVINFGGVVAPFGNSIVTRVGIASEGQEWLLAKPVVLSPVVRIVISGLVNLCVLALIIGAFRNGRRYLHPSHRAALSVFGIFSLGYTALILPGALIGLAFDRYMLPLVPLLMLVALLQFARHRRPVPLIAWCCLLLFSFYGIVMTHDYSAAVRARLAAADELETTGIQREQISAGFEYDGWTQVERSGYVRVVQFEDSLTDDHRKGFWFEFWDHCGNFRPDFVVLTSTAPKAAGGQLRVDFRTWAPPFRRSAVAWKRSDLTALYQLAGTGSSMR
jgi:hypothetical protein